MRVSPTARERSFDYAPAVSFVVITVIGSAYIIAAKLYDLPAWIVTFVPVALMLGYALMILMFRRLRQRDDQSGDNFYYMGFIFTLVSLGISLWQFNAGSGVDEIIRNFGVAIASTITGIILRIFFSQLRRDPIEIEQVSRQDLAEASRRVRRELDQVSQELAHFRRTNQQMIDEGYVESRSHSKSLLLSTQSAIEELSKTATDGLQRSTTELAEQFSSAPLRGQLNETAKGLDKINTSLLAAASTIATAAATLSEKVASMETPDQILEVKIQPVIDGLETVVGTALDRVDEKTKEISALRDEVQLSTRQLNETTERLQRLTMTPNSALNPRKGIFRWFHRRTNKHQ